MIFYKTESFGKCRLIGDGGDLGTFEKVTVRIPRKWFAPFAKPLRQILCRHAWKFFNASDDFECQKCGAWKPSERDKARKSCEKILDRLSEEDSSFVVFGLSAQYRQPLKPTHISQMKMREIIK